MSDLKGWGSETVSEYDIGYIPSNVLIDPEGIIIAKNLVGEELNKKLQDIFNK